MYNNNYTDMYALPVFSLRKKGFAIQPAKPLKKNQLPIIKLFFWH